MINKSDLLDPMALEKRSPYEQKVIDGAHNAGHSPRYINVSKTSAGSLQQVINPAAIRAAECGAPGCDSIYLTVSEVWLRLYRREPVRWGLKGRQTGRDQNRVTQCLGAGWRFVRVRTLTRSFQHAAE